PHRATTRRADFARARWSRAVAENCRRECAPCLSSPFVWTTRHRRTGFVWGSSPPLQLFLEGQAMRLQDREANITQEPRPGRPIEAEASVESHGLYRVGLAYGRFIYRFRWIVLILWLIGLSVSIPFAAKLPGILTGGGYSFGGSESTHVNAVLTSKLNQPGAELLVAFTSTTAGVSDAAYQAEIASAANAARAFPQ